mmetsp:Transcript_75960/g.203525  ORF Transcript_75960/g.203525 Transcript_75960/m.203525 type:complete len:153 (-) Transcript_75960:1326-1784(-)
MLVDARSYFLLLRSPWAVFVFAIVGQDLFQDLNPNKFGNFKVSLYTVFEICTLDLWSVTAESVKDPKYGSDDVDPTSAIFFVVLIVVRAPLSPFCFALLLSPPFSQIPLPHKSLLLPPPMPPGARVSALSALLIIFFRLPCCSHVLMIVCPS